MRNRPMHINSYLLGSLLAFTPFCFGAPASAQSMPAQTDKLAQQDNDTTRRDLAQFDQFLDSHPEIAEQVRKDPSLVTNKNFLTNHPALQTYLQDHSAIREEITENPNAFMRQEDRFDRAGDDRDRDNRPRELAQFDQFLDGHREIAEQVRKDPSLLDNKSYLTAHPDLQTYLQDHPGVREEVKANPDAFMRQEDRFDRAGDDRDRDNRPRELAQFDQFLDGHREIAEQVRKDPSLLDNKSFLTAHPDLQTYLQDHPGVREEVKANPDAFMRQEDRFGRAGDDRDRENRPRELAQFDQFLDSHREIAEQVRKDPSLLDNKGFLTTHPAVQTYLQDHPEVREDIRANPDAFMRQEDRFDRTDNRYDRDSNRQQMASFGDFLGHHSNIAKEMSENPSRAKDPDYMKNRPELQAYLNAHPDVQAELWKDPDSFVKGSQGFSNNVTPSPTNGSSYGGSSVKTPAAVPDAKPKQ